MGTEQHKTVRGPVRLVEMHSSGRCAGQIGNKNVYLGEGIPGECVTFTLERRKRGFYGGKIMEITEPSVHRVSPFCKHYHSCGGCNWQHIGFLKQLELKQGILISALRKYGIDTPDIPPVIASPGTVFYRHRMEYSFAAHAFRDNREKEPAGPALGFHISGEPGKIAAIRECYLQAEPCREICDYIERFAIEHNLAFYDHENRSGILRSLSIRINRQGDVLVVVGFAEDIPSQREKLLSAVLQRFSRIVSLNYTIHLSPTHSQLQGEIVAFGNTRPYLYETIDGHRFRIHAASFFQPNADQAEQIFTKAREWAGLSGSEKVYDLYTGIGTLAVIMAPSARHVTGIEGSGLAIQDANENAAINGLHNTEFLTGDILETFKPGFIEKHGKADLIVLDPPRSGTLIEIKKTINASGAGKVIYLSCNPVSLAFDLKQLTEVYRISRIQPFDMLPHTHHLETLVLLERR